VGRGVWFVHLPRRQDWFEIREVGVILGAGGFADGRQGDLR
jgi:hypothetical protein